MLLFIKFVLTDSLIQPLQLLSIKLGFFVFFFMGKYEINISIKLGIFKRVSFL